MIPVYQTIIDPGHGNCMQAAIASLLELPLHEIPHFLEFDNPYSELCNFILNMGYDFHGFLYNYPKSEYSTIHRLKSDSELVGIKGLFYASVYSPRYYDAKNGNNQVTHAVLIDKNYNIVFDPNPNNKDIRQYPNAEEQGYNGILSILMINDKINA